MTKATESTQIFMHDPTSPKLARIINFASKQVHGHAEAMSPDVAMTILGAAVNALTFYGHSTESITKIVDAMRKSAINAFGPSGNEADCENIRPANGGH